MAVWKTLRSRSGDSYGWKKKDGPGGQSCRWRFQIKTGNKAQRAAMGAEVRSPECRRPGLPGSSMWPFDLVRQEGGWTGGGEVAKWQEGVSGGIGSIALGKRGSFAKGMS